MRCSSRWAGPATRRSSSRGQVKARHIARNAVTGAKVKDRNLRREDLRPTERGPLTYTPFKDVEAGRTNSPIDGTVLVLSPEYAAVPSTQVDLPVQPTGRRVVGASRVLLVDVLTRSSGGEADLDCAIATVRQSRTLITARGYATLRPGHSQLSFAGFYPGSPKARPAPRAYRCLNRHLARRVWRLLHDLPARPP